MSATFINGYLAHYEVIGRGKPVLFLHGWLGSWRYWMSTMQAISSSNRAYAIDFWGFGDSAKNQRYTIQDQTEMLSAFLEKIGIFEITVVGHGMGGIIAFELGRLNPDLINKIMAISLPLSPASINTRMLFGDLNALVDRVLGKGAFAENVKVDQEKNEMRAISINIDELDLLEVIDWINLFGKTSLLVFGQNDALIRPPQADLLQKLNEHVHTIIFDRSNHFPMIDENSAFSRLLAEFLELSEEDSPRNLQIKEKWKRRLR